MTILRRLLPLLAALMLSTAIQASSGTVLVVRIADPNPTELSEHLREMGFYVQTVRPGDVFCDVSASDAELAILEEAGYRYKVISEGRPFKETQAERAASGQRGTGGYLDLAATLSTVQQTIGAYPDIARYVDLTEEFGAPPTSEGRHIYGVKISDNVALDENEAAVLLVAGIHSDEIVNPVIARYIIEQLTAQYAGTPWVQALVIKYEIWVIPVLNPDGYNYVFEGSENWRKNRSPQGDTWGVDLNRNFPFGWDHECGGSLLTASSTYRGPAAASEAETQTIMLMSRDRRFAKVLDLHSSGQEVLYGYACLDHPLQEAMKLDAIDLSYDLGYAGARRSPTALGELYEWQLSEMGSFSFLVETATSQQPWSWDADAEAELTWLGILRYLTKQIPVWGNITDAGTGAPIAATLSIRDIVFEHDETNYSRAANGRYHVFVPDGTYELIFRADGYVPQGIAGVVVDNTVSLQMDVALYPVATGVAQSGAADIEVLGGDALLGSVSFRVHRSTRARLKVYDVRGALVRTLVDGVTTPGRYDVVWDGLDDAGGRAASGGYVYRLESERVRETGRFVMIR